MREIFRGKFGETYGIEPGFEWYQNSAVLNAEIQIVEMEPQRRTIRWRKENCMTSYHTYNWPFPYLQFIFFCGQIGVAASSKPHQLGQKFNHASFPNVYFSGLVCQDLCPTLDQALVYFFGSSFDSPYRWAQPRGLARELFDMKKLAHPSKTAQQKWNFSYSERLQDLSVDAMLSFNWTLMGPLGQWDTTMEQPLGNLWPFYKNVIGEYE